MKKNNLYIKITFLIIVLFGINTLSNHFKKRFDLTQDQRYTLSKETYKVLESIDESIYIKVYLQGDFPAEFKRIQLETNQILEELSSINNHIAYRFVDPKNNTEELVNKGLQPSRLTVQEEGKNSEAIIFPWAVVSYKNKTANVSLLNNSFAPTQEIQLQKSVENLEYEFTNAFQKITTEKNKKIAIIKGNGQLNDIYMYSFLNELKTHYKLAEFTLDSVSTNPQKTLKELSEYDLSIIAKPSLRFTEAEKYTLDQFIMQGGKSLWLIDNVMAELDSLMQNGNAMAFNRDLNLTDLLFNYGVRINYDITQDLYSSSIRLASGNLGNQTQYQDFLWHYYPIVISDRNHEITTNLDPVLLKFPSSMDTLANDNVKTILLQSSPFTKLTGSPANISLNEIETEPTKETFNQGNKFFGVLIEGNFKSAYATRTKPFETANFKSQVTDNKMVVISDGDIIANELFRGEPLPLNIDKWTNQPYGNSAFLLNSIHDMLDDSGILKLRSKNLQIQFLDKEKAYQEKTFWQVINILLPILVLTLFGLFFNYYRRRKYSS